MRANRGADTRPELELRRALHARGLRYRANFRVRAPELSVLADVVFPRLRVVVFVDGCFWHGCPEHCRVPERNSVYWQAKINRNRRRDAAVTVALNDSGWRVIRTWEHEPVAGSVAKIEAALSAASPTFTE